MKYDLEELMKENMNIQESPSEELKERILNYDKEERIMSKKGKYMKHVPKIAAAALTVAILSGGVAYASPRLWNHFVAKDFGVEKNPEMMQDMNDKGFAGQPHTKGEEGKQLSVTDKDITVTVKQTLADEHSAYVCFEVKYGDQYQAVQKGKTAESDYGVVRPNMDFQLDNALRFNYSGSVTEIVDDHTVLYDYFLTTVDMNDTFKDSIITMKMYSFIMNEAEDAEPIVLAKGGNWDLSWDLSIGTEKQVYHIDKMLTLGENHFNVKDLEISPLSCYLTLESPDGVCLDEIHAVVEAGEEEKAKSLLDENGDIKVIRYLRAFPLDEELNEVRKKIPEGQMLVTLDFLAIRLDDKDFDGMGGICSVDMKGTYSQFDKILNPDEVKGIRVGGKYIDLTGISPETVQ